MLGKPQYDIEMRILSLSLSKISQYNSSYSHTLTTTLQLQTIVMYISLILKISWVTHDSHFSEKET